MKLGVRSSISFFLTMNNSKMVLKKFLSPLNLSKVQIFCIYKFTKIIFVSQNKDLVFKRLQVLSSSFKAFNNG